jgi:tetratricopeptide (TPR) repeat protein
MESMKCFQVFLALLLCLLSARGEGPDDHYVRIYNSIQQADSLESSGQTPQALAKCLDAQAALQRFQLSYPDWNPKVVTYRLSYLATRIAALSARTPAPAAAPTTISPTPQSPQKSAASDYEPQLNLLKEQTRQLQADKALLEAKLKEALTARPAASEPQTLAAAEERIKSLQKENDLLKVALAQEKSKPPARDLVKKHPEPAPNPANTAALENSNKALADANAKLTQQLEISTKLSLEKELLQKKLKTLTAENEAAAALRAENEILKKQVAELKSPASAPKRGQDPRHALAEAQAQIAALQSDKELLRLEKIALQNRVKQLSGGSNVVASAATSAETGRVKQLGQEKEALRAKLDEAIQQAYARKGKSTASRVEELEQQLATLRARLQVFEARQVPYTPEELVLFKAPGPKLAGADPKAGKKSIKELPAGTAKMVAEAQRYFSARQLDKAEEKYLQVLKQDESNVFTLANLAAIQLERNQYEEAEKHLQQALATAPNDAYSLSILGYLKFRTEKYDEALDALSRAAQLSPDSAEIQNFLGLTLSHKGMRASAETALRRAIQLQPGYASAHNNLAVIYFTQQPPLLELARWHYQKALAAGHPQNSDLEKAFNSRKVAENTP